MSEFTDEIKDFLRVLVDSVKRDRDGYLKERFERIGDNINNLNKNVEDKFLSEKEVQEKAQENIGNNIDRVINELDKYEENLNKFVEDTEKKYLKKTDVQTMIDHEFKKRNPLWKILGIIATVLVLFVGGIAGLSRHETILNEYNSWKPKIESGIDELKRNMYFDNQREITDKEKFEKFENRLNTTEKDVLILKSKQ